MRHSHRMLIIATALAVISSSAPAMARGSHSYAGAWPVTVSRSQRSNGTGCLTLVGGASSGSASLVFEGQKYTYGSFLVIDDILMATITEPLYGQNGALTFSASAHNGHIAQGLFENIEGGSNFDAGALEFGMKNGC